MTRRTPRSSLLLFRFFVVWLIAIDCPSSTTTKASILPLLSSSRKTNIQEAADVLLVPWIKSRTAATASLDEYTNGRPASLWLYQGSLMDPLTGKVLANVEGFEVLTLQGLWENATDENDDTTKSYLERLPPSPVSNWTRSLFQRRDHVKVRAAGTWESRKLFLYRTTDESGELLTNIRLRPAGPQRKVPLSQAISTWHATTTVLQIHNEKGKSPDHFFFGTALNVAPQHQQGQSSQPTMVWNTAPVTWEPTVTQESNGKKKKKRRTKNRQETPTGNLEFTVHARPRHGSQEAALQRHFAQSTTSSGLSPPRSAIVSLSGNRDASSPSEATAAHETYRYHLPTGRVSYSRYGEGPVWYGPHRACRLELRGQAQADLTQLSPVVQELVRRLVTTPQLTVDSLFPEEVKLREVAEKWPIWYKHAQWVQPHWQRLVQATTMQALPSREW